MKRKTYTIRLQPEIKAAIQHEAKKNQRTLSDLLEEVIKKHLSVR